MRSWFVFGSRKAPEPIQCSTPMIERPRLALKLFRGEPAISEFDWHFTAIHSSSPSFSTLVSSVLHGTLLPLQPGHGYVTRFRVYCTRLIALFRLAFAPAPSFADLTSPRARTSSAHSSKGTPSGYRSSETGRQHPLTACRHEVSGTISLPFRGAFHLSLTVLVRYRSPRAFSLGGWSAQFPA